jgi:TPR repeat protein
LDGVDIETNRRMGVSYLRGAADQGLIAAQLHLARLLRQGWVI